MSIIRKTKRMFSLNDDSHYNMSKFPVIYPEQFKEKFNDLLQKVSIQNRYASRISQCNLKNMQQLQRAREQLQRVANQKKLKELSSSNDKEMLNEISIRLNRNEDELQNIFKQLVEAKRQIKVLKRQIATLQRTNSELQKQIIRVKRGAIMQNTSVMELNEDEILRKKISNYMQNSINRRSFLYRYCQKIEMTKGYANFFEVMQRKIQEQTYPQRIYKQSIVHKSRIQSQSYPMKKRSITPYKTKMNRYKTQVYDIKSR